MLRRFARLSKNRRTPLDLQVLEDRLPVAESSGAGWMVAALDGVGAASGRGNAPQARLSAGATSAGLWIPLGGAQTGAEPFDDGLAGGRDHATADTPLIDP